MSDSGGLDAAFASVAGAGRNLLLIGIIALSDGRAVGCDC